MTVGARYMTQSHDDPHRKFYVSEQNIALRCPHEQRGSRSGSPGDGRPERAAPASPQRWPSAGPRRGGADLSGAGGIGIGGGGGEVVQVLAEQEE